jgi:hypothetical protein
MVNLPPRERGGICIIVEGNGDGYISAGLRRITLGASNPSRPRQKCHQKRRAVRMSRRSLARIPHRSVCRIKSTCPGFFPRFLPGFFPRRAKRQSCRKNIRGVQSTKT